MHTTPHNTGWIKLHRSIVDWSWYNNSEISRVFMHLIILAAYQPTSQLEVGEVWTSRRKLSEELNISEKKIRTALSKLIEQEEIFMETYTTGTKIRVLNYGNIQYTRKYERAHEKRLKGPTTFCAQNTTKIPKKGPRKTTKRAHHSPPIYIKKFNYAKDMNNIKQNTKQQQRRAAAPLEILFPEKDKTYLNDVRDTLESVISIKKDSGYSYNPEGLRNRLISDLMANGNELQRWKDQIKAYQLKNSKKQIREEENSKMLMDYLRMEEEHIKNQNKREALINKFILLNDLEQKVVYDKAVAFGCNLPKLDPRIDNPIFKNLISTAMEEYEYEKT